MPNFYLIIYYTLFLLRIDWEFRKIIMPSKSIETVRNWMYNVAKIHVFSQRSDLSTPNILLLIDIQHA